MGKLKDFLYRLRITLLFIGLEIACFWMIVSFNQRQNADFLNSSNIVIAKILSKIQDVNDYFNLVEINKRLSKENEFLQIQSLVTKDIHEIVRSDSKNFVVVGAKIVSNTYRRGMNYLTIAAGRKDGVIPGMGVISVRGIIGQVKSASKNFATVYSLLHPQLMISSMVNRTKTNCTIQWGQENYQFTDLKYIPRHIDLIVGDTVVTSGYNSVFPPGILIGIISELNLEEHMVFYEAKVELSVDFTSLTNVLVIRNEMKREIDSLNML